MKNREKKEGEKWEDVENTIDKYLAEKKVTLRVTGGWVETIEGDKKEFAIKLDAAEYVEPPAER